MQPDRPPSDLIVPEMVGTIALSFAAISLYLAGRIEAAFWTGCLMAAWSAGLRAVSARRLRRFDRDRFAAARRRDEVRRKAKEAL